jgi:hypothetical protein
LNVALVRPAQPDDRPEDLLKSLLQCACAPQAGSELA